MSATPASVGSRANAHALREAIVAQHPIADAHHGASVQSFARQSTPRAGASATFIRYFNSAPAVKLPAGASVSAWQGIRGSNAPNRYLIVGTVNGKTPVGQSLGRGILFDGTINGRLGRTYFVDYPNAQFTSVFGPDNARGGRIRLVGNYRNLPDPLQQVQEHGFLFQGTPRQLNDPARYTTIDYKPDVYNYDTMHSISGNFAVGNASAVSTGTTPRTLTAVAFLYDLQTKAFTEIAYPSSADQTVVSTTAYGIWYNGGTHYTICGGYKTTQEQIPLPLTEFPFGTAFLVDYDAATGAFSHWTSYRYPGTPGGTYLTHFEGISGAGRGTYQLNADWSTPDSSAQGASVVTVRRNADGSFSSGQWTTLNDTGLNGITSSNAVYRNAVVGIVYHGTQSTPYQAIIRQVPGRFAAASGWRRLANG